MYVFMSELLSPLTTHSNYLDERSEITQFIEDQLELKPGQETFQPDTSKLSAVVVKALGQNTSNIIQSSLDTETIKLESVVQKVGSG